MTTRFRVNACVAVFGVLVPALASAQGARIQLDQLSHLAAKAEKVVDVTVDSGMLQQALAFLAAKEPGSAKVRDLIQGISAIYVKSFEFKEPAPYSASDVDSIRKQVSGPGWSRVVRVQEQKELTEIYFWREGNENRGLVVLSAEPAELTIVNIVGRIDLASLAAIGPMIPQLSGAATASAGAGVPKKD